MAQLNLLSDQTMLRTDYLDVDASYFVWRDKEFQHWQCLTLPFVVIFRIVHNNSSVIQGRRLSPCLLPENNGIMPRTEIPGSI